MKKMYVKPEADKIQFNYRDQVVAASTGGDTGSNDSFLETSAGIGSPICGSGGVVDRLFDFAGSSVCA